MITKINDNVPCLDPSHNVPKHLLLQPGIYQHICQSCGKTIIFEVLSISY